MKATTVPDAKAILADLEGRGFQFEIVGSNLKKVGGGTLSAEDISSIKSAKLGLMAAIQEREQAFIKTFTPLPWSDSEAAEFLAKAQAAFGPLWNDLASSDQEKKRIAAMGVLCDSLAMLAEAQRNRDIEEFKNKSLFIEFLCETVRRNLK